MTDFLKTYAKTITAVITGLIGWAIAYQIADEQWIALATVLAVAFGVYAVPNKTS